MTPRSHWQPKPEINGPRFSVTDFQALPFLGTCTKLAFRQAWCQIDMVALSAHPISQNELLVMWATENGGADADGDLSETMAPKQLVVLRVEDWEGTPSGDSMLRCSILGSFNQGPDPGLPWRFTSQISLNRPASAFDLYAPSPKVVQGLVNGLLRAEGLMDLGRLRYNEQAEEGPQTIVVRINMQDMLTKRTAMLGKTRFGKSNVVKLIAQGMLDFTQHAQNVGQLLFDVSGEYSNPNPARGEVTLASHNRGRCTAYFLTERQGTADGRLLRFNFFMATGQALEVIRELLPASVLEADAVRSFLTCRLADLSSNNLAQEPVNPRHLRKIMLYWTVLDAAGFGHDPARIKTCLQELGIVNPFNPGFSPGLRQAAYQAIHNAPAPAVPQTMAALLMEMSTMARFRTIYTNDPNLMISGRPVFDSEEDIIIAFLCNSSGQGPYQLRACLPYHSPTAEDFVQDILQSLDEGRTVIIDLSSAPERVVRYFAQRLCLAIFAAQEHKLNRDALEGHYIQIYFEEAHAIFPIEDSNTTQVYNRFAKEGAKFHIGIIYATQSPTTINPDLLAQTENFFIGHLSSQKEVDALCNLQVAFQGCENAIRFNRTPGLMQVLTHSHRYVVPVQVRLYEGSGLIVSD
jgi:DNA helicase HerA-like ATPase